MTQPERPRPQYGEYAPGFGEPTPSGQEPTAPAQSGTVPGVPHNLGVGEGAAPPSPPAPHTAPLPPQQSTAGSGGASVPPQAPQPAPPAYPQATGTQPPAGYQPPPASNQRPIGGGIIADRVVTILLLLIGAGGALSTVASFLTLQRELGVLADAMGLEGFVVPSAVGGIATAGAAVTGLLYVATLLWSVQRLRRNKITFWIPLTAGVVSVIVLFVFATIAVSQAPEIVDNLTPDKINDVLDSLSTR